MRGETLLVGVLNLRDLGGLRTASGRVVAPNRIYRSSHFANLTPADEVVLGRLGLRTLVDLRGDVERATMPGRVRRQSGLVELHLPIEPKALTALRELHFAETIDEAALVALMHDIYRRFVLEHTAAFSTFLHRLLEPSSLPLVFHCTAGKDRTGFATALLLSALGVPRATIIDDYLESNERWLPGESANDWVQLARARADYLQLAFDAMNEGWGSVDGYLARALGIDDAARAGLAEKLLVDA